MEVNITVIFAHPNSRLKKRKKKKRSNLRVWYSGLVPSVRLPVLAQSRRVVERTILMLPEDHEVVEEALFRLLVLLNLCTS